MDVVNKPIFILLHGGGVGPWSVCKVAELLKEDFDVYTPTIEGHSNCWETPFTSIEDSAKQLILYFEKEIQRPIYGIAGLSLGAQIVLEVLNQKPDFCEVAVIESALVKPMPFVTKLMIPMYKWTQALIKKRWFAKLQAKSLCIEESDFETYFKESQQMTLESMMNLAKSNGLYSIKPNLHHTKAKCLIFVGEREPKVMLKSAELIHQTLMGSHLVKLPNYAHGELSLKNPKQYIALIQEYTN